jgi:hypothetical protein
MHGNADEGQEIEESPDPEDGQAKGNIAKSVVEDDGGKGMEANQEAKGARCHITGGQKPMAVRGSEE